jgi:hypothetical protein
MLMTNPTPSYLRVFENLKYERYGKKSENPINTEAWLSALSLLPNAS